MWWDWGAGVDVGDKFVTGGRVSKQGIEQWEASGSVSQKEATKSSDVSNKHNSVAGFLSHVFRT